MLKSLRKRKTNTVPMSTVPTSGENQAAFMAMLPAGGECRLKVIHIKNLR